MSRTQGDSITAEDYMEFNEALRDPEMRYKFARAVTAQAANDYREISERNKDCRQEKAIKKNEAKLKKIETFLLSDYFYTLTDLDGEAFLVALKKEVG